MKKNCKEEVRKKVGLKEGFKKSFGIVGNATKQVLGSLGGETQSSKKVGTKIGKGAKKASNPISSIDDTIKALPD